MVSQIMNQSVNNRLSELYLQFTEPYLAAYVEVFADDDPPSRINEFGIIDESRYDYDNGILVIAKETDGWSNEDYACGVLFRSWMNNITLNGLHGHARRHPTMWYNIGRWVSYILDPSQQLERLAEMYPISEIGRVAYTNMNKVRGGTQSGDQYWQLANSDISGEILRKEIEILQPKVIVCCGTYREFIHHVPCFEGIVVDMPHPGARKRKLDMLALLAQQFHSK